MSDNEGWTVDNVGVLRHTLDGGITWSSIATGEYFLRMDFIDAINGYATTSDVAYKTTDGGISWSPLLLPGPITRILYFQNSEIGFISGVKNIYRTADGGATWSTISTGVIFTDYFFINSLLGFATAIDKDSSKCIWRTTDGGLTWNDVLKEDHFFMNSIWFTDENTGWAAGYAKPTGWDKLPVINKTTDGGATWENVYINRFPGNDGIGEEFIDIRFVGDRNGFALSTYSESLGTSDGGETWSLTYDASSEIIPSYGVYRSLDGYETMYLTGENGYVTTWK